MCTRWVVGLSLFRPHLTLTLTLGLCLTLSLSSLCLPIGGWIDGSGTGTDPAAMLDLQSLLADCWFMEGPTEHGSTIVDCGPYKPVATPPKWTMEYR
jgi:hypothetical protein